MESEKTLQKFASIHTSIYNHFNLERHLIPRADRIPVVDLIGVMVGAYVGCGKDGETMVLLIRTIERHLAGRGIVEIGARLGSRPVWRNRADGKAVPAHWHQ